MINDKLNKEDRIKLFTHVDNLMWGTLAIFLPIIGYFFFKLIDKFDIIFWLFGLLVITVVIYCSCSMKEISLNLLKKIEEEIDMEIFGDRKLKSQYFLYMVLLISILLVWIFYFYHYGHLSQKITSISFALILMINIFCLGGVFNK